MRWSRRYALSFLIMLLLHVTSVGLAQTSPGASRESLVRPETLAARKAAIQAQLEQVGPGTVAADDVESLRVQLDQQLKVLLAMEAAWQKRAWYAAQLEHLPRHVQDLTVERQTLSSRPQRHFSEVSERLRDEHEEQIQAIQAELDGLHTEQTAAELRLLGLPQELEQRAAELEQNAKDLLSARSEAASAGEQKLSLLEHFALQELQLQWQQAEIDSLEAEREWLTRQGPLQDAQHSLAQTRLSLLQQELEAIQEQLTQVLSRETNRLAATAEALEQQLQHTADPIENLVLAAGLETVQARQGTAEYRQRLNQVSQQVMHQEKRIAREKQEMEHLTALAEKRASGEHVARRLQVAFARLQREQLRAQTPLVPKLEQQLDTLSGQHLDVQDRLYEFDRHAEERLSRLATTLQTTSAAPPEAHLATARRALDEHKTALREQQQALAALEQELSNLLSLHRAHLHLLDDGYQFVRTKMFWLRDEQTIGWTGVQNALTGLKTTLARWRTMTGMELAHLPRDWQHGGRFWALLAGLWVALPCGAWWLAQHLRRWVQGAITSDPRQAVFDKRFVTAGVILAQTAIWPLYLALVAWVWPQLWGGRGATLELELALGEGLQVAALVLWMALLAWTFCRRAGWCETYLGCSPEVCRQFRGAVAFGCLAALLFLVPRHVLRTAPGDPEIAHTSLALARLCFTAFELAILGLVGVVCRRGSRLLTASLATSHQAHGMMWRLWPLLHAGLCTGLLALTILDLLGYRYAARFLWSRSGIALVVLVGLWAIDQAVDAIVKRLAARRLQAEDPISALAQPNQRSLLQQGQRFLRGVLILSGVLAIQHLYGLDQNILHLLDAVHLLDIGKTPEGETLWLTLGDITTALVIIAGSVVVMRYLPGLYEVAVFPRVQWDSGLRYTFLTLSRYTLFFLTVWWSLAVIHIHWSNIQWIVAAVSVGLGFGLQEIVGNFVSGLILLLERPIRVDDVVTVGDQQGMVKRITIRATAIQNWDNQTVIIPNKEFIVGRVTNWTLGDTHVRLVIPVGVAYGSDLDLVQRLLADIVNEHPKVMPTPPPLILLRSLGDSALQWEIFCFVPRPQDRALTAHEILLRIDHLFRQHGVDIPFPQQDVHVRSVAAAMEVRPPENGQAPSSPTT